MDDERPISSVNDGEQQEDMIESDINPRNQGPMSPQDHLSRLLANLNQQPLMQLTHALRRRARYGTLANASGSTPPRRPSTQDPPQPTREQILQRYENELQSLNGHWNSICIALTSIRSSYLAVLSSPSADQQHESQSSPPPPPSSTSTSSSTPSPTSTQHSPITDFLIPSAVAVTSFMTTRNNTTTQSDLEQELLLAVDDAMFQIRQLEARIERLEAHIQELVQSIPRRQE